MTAPRVFVLREPRHAAEMVAFVKQHAGQAANDGRPLRVTVAPLVEKRSDRANAFMWAAVLEPIARYACVAGRYFSPEVWHEHYKREFLPEKTSSGKEKWRWLPNGERDLVIGTSDLDRHEFAVYLEQVQADAATNHGVVFDDAWKESNE